MNFLLIIVRILRVYKVLLIIRIAISWFGVDYRNSKIIQLLSNITDPYLDIFRRYFPIKIGMLDLSPVLAFLFIQFIIYLLLRMI